VIVGEHFGEMLRSRVAIPNHLFYTIHASGSLRDNEFGQLLGRYFACR
jgi:hypothetical protein